MPRNTTAIALFLALLTGFVLGQMATIGIQKTEIAAKQAPLPNVVAQRFYDGINDYLESGDSSAMLDSLHEDFVDHSHVLERSGTADDLLRYFASVRTVFPGLRLDGFDTEAQGDAIIVDLKLSGDLVGDFAGWELDGTSPTNGLEILRIEGDKIAERWASSALPPRFELEIAFDGPADTRSSFEPLLERYRLGPGESLSFINGGGAAVVVEHGQIALSREPSRLKAADSAGGLGNGIGAGHVAEDGEDWRLADGDAASLPSDRAFRIRNHGVDAATVLVLSIRRLDPSTGHPNVHKLDPDTEVDLLATGGFLKPGSGSLQIVVGRGLLPAGAIVPDHLVSGSEMLLVNGGSVEVSIGEGDVMAYRPWTFSKRVQDTHTLLANDGLGTDDDASVAYRAIGPAPADILVISISQASIGAVAR